MSTNIEWTDETWNPTVGCDRISPGCAHCYAKTLHDKRHAAHQRGSNVPAQYAQPFDVLQLMEGRLDAPLHWRQPRRVFVNSVSDLFHQDAPDAFIDRVFAVMALAPQHTFQILTKRAERMRDYLLTLTGSVERMDDLEAEIVGGAEALEKDALAEPALAAVQRWPLQNVWLGVSVENQRFADERIPLLLQTPAAVRFISAEPLLGPIDVRRWLRANVSQREHVSTGKVVIRQLDGLDWIITGGESGRGARPMDIAWVRSLKEQVAATMGGTRLFVKQLGRNAVCRNDERDEGWPGCTVPIDDDYEPREQGETTPLVFRDRKGGDPAEWSEDLRIRQFPGGQP